MKFSALKSLGHNIAHSLASGVGLPIGIWGTKIFQEASAASPGYIDVDFIAGTTSGSPCSRSLRGAVGRYSSKALLDLCVKHGVDLSEVRTIRARFQAPHETEPEFTVTVESCGGKRSVDRYIGWGGERPRIGMKE